MEAHFLRLNSHLSQWSLVTVKRCIDPLIFSSVTRWKELSEGKVKPWKHCKRRVHWTDIDFFMWAIFLVVKKPVSVGDGPQGTIYPSHMDIRTCCIIIHVFHIVHCGAAAWHKHFFLHPKRLLIPLCLSHHLIKRNTTHYYLLNKMFSQMSDQTHH